MAKEKKTAKKTTKKAAKKAATKSASSKASTTKPAPRAATTIISRSVTIATEAPPQTNLDTLYIIDDSDHPITLSITVGDVLQTSDMTVRLDGAPIVEEHDGDLEETTIGTNKQLKGKQLSIVATITDTSHTTNLTSLTIHLKGGFRDLDFELHKTVDNEGDSADYLCLITFFRP